MPENIELKTSTSKPDAPKSTTTTSSSSRNPNQRDQLNRDLVKNKKVIFIIAGVIVLAILILILALIPVYINANKKSDETTTTVTTTTAQMNTTMTTMTMTTTTVTTSVLLPGMIDITTSADIGVVKIQSGFNRAVNCTAELSDVDYLSAACQNSVSTTLLVTVLASSTCTFRCDPSTGITMNLRCDLSSTNSSLSLMDLNTSFSLASQFVANQLSQSASPVRYIDFSPYSSRMFVHGNVTETGSAIMIHYEACEFFNFQKVNNCTIQAF